LSGFKTNISVMAERIGEKVLVERTSRDEEVSFESLISRYTGEIGLLANRLLGWPGDVEDITQEVFLAAFVGLKKFRHDCDIKSWLFTITINKCRTFRYKQLFHRRKIIKTLDAESHPAADNKMLDDETFHKVRQTIKALPVKYREAVVLRYLQELDIEEISKILGISINTLHVRLNRARERLKNELKDIIS
jgi:RNA polymerase sigma-70 factor (ECF subfamily)